MNKLCLVVMLAVSLVLALGQPLWAEDWGRIVDVYPSKAEYHLGEEVKVYVQVKNTTNERQQYVVALEALDPNDQVVYDSHGGSEEHRPLRDDIVQWLDSDESVVFGPFAFTLASNLASGTYHIITGLRVYPWDPVAQFRGVQWCPPEDTFEVVRSSLSEDYLSDMAIINGLLLDYLAETGVRTVSGKVLSSVVRKSMETLAVPLPPPITILSLLTIPLEIVELRGEVDKVLTVYLADFLNIEREYEYPQLGRLTGHDERALQEITRLQERINEKVMAVFEYAEEHPRLFTLKSHLYMGPLRDIPKLADCMMELEEILQTSGASLSDLELLQVAKQIEAETEDLASPENQDYTGDRITLNSGILNGNEINALNPAITVSPATKISGTLNITVYSCHSSGAIVPVGATPTWGNRKTSYWTIARHVQTGNTTHTIRVNLTAPRDAGMYYLIVAVSGQMDVGDIMSCTSWNYPKDSPMKEEVWNDGNDVVDWTTTTIQRTIDYGWTALHFLNDTGEYMDVNWGATAVRIIVKST